MGTIAELKLREDVPVVVADQHGVIIYINQSFETVFQWASDEIVGKPLTTIIPPMLHDAHHLGFSRFLATEQSRVLNQALNLKAMKKDGEIFAAEHIIQAEKVDGVWLFAASLRPLEG
ncbi:MAG: PAS domain S-box protein [Gammaproteobacteria bacterium]|nr:MAG: PAS domain S-box protein [Gammaproteobacteria bacterium]